MGFYGTMLFGHCSISCLSKENIFSSKKKNPSIKSNWRYGSPWLIEFIPRCHLALPDNTNWDTNIKQEQWSTGAPLNGLIWWNVLFYWSWASKGSNLEALLSQVVNNQKETRSTIIEKHKQQSVSDGRW